MPTPRPKGGDLRSQRIKKYRDVILAAVDAQVDITHVELSGLLHEQHGTSFAASTIWRFLDRHEMTFKKTAHASEQERPDVAVLRQAWFDAQPDLDPAHLVFIDEPELPPRWRVSAAVLCVDSVAARLSRTDIGRPPPSQVRSGSAA